MDMSDDNEPASELTTTKQDDQQHLPRKIVHSKSMGDLSPEEDRAKAYNTSQEGGLTSSESFNNFLYWRDPLPILDDLDGLNKEQQQPPPPEANDDNDTDVLSVNVYGEKKGMESLLNN